MDIQPTQSQNNFAPNSSEGQSQKFYPEPSRGTNKKLITIVLLILASGAGAYWYFTKDNPVACTQEAIQCADGSYVGRSGPNCEFAACPQAKDETASWQTYRNEQYGFEVKYPTNVNFKIINSLDSSMFLSEFSNLPSNISSLGLNINVGVGYEAEGTDIMYVGPLNIKRFTYRGASNLSKTNDLTVAIWYYPIGSTSSNVKNIFSLKMSSNPEQRDDAFKYFDQILSSFKFTVSTACKNSPQLIRIGLKSEQANIVYIKENNSLNPVSYEQWKANAYKEECLDRYYIDDLPAQILSYLPESNFLNREKQDLTGWKTYENKDLGIKLSYPSYWEGFYEATYAASGLVYGCVDLCAMGVAGDCNWSGAQESAVTQSGNPQTCIRSHLSINKKGERSGSWDIKKIEKITFPDRSTGIYFESNNNNNYSFSVVKDGIFYEYSFPASYNKDMDKYLNEFATIISNLNK